VSIGQTKIEKQVEDRKRAEMREKKMKMQLLCKYDDFK
jgi:hypothetical protein